MRAGPQRERQPDHGVPDIPHARDQYALTVEHHLGGRAGRPSDADDRNAARHRRRQRQIALRSRHRTGERETGCDPNEEVRGTHFVPLVDNPPFSSDFRLCERAEISCPRAGKLEATSRRSTISRGVKNERARMAMPGA